MDHLSRWEPKRRQLPATAFVSRRSVNNNSNREIKAAEFNPSNAKIQHQQERRSKQKIFKVFLTPNRPLLQRFTRETKSPAGWLFESSFIRNSFLSISFDYYAIQYNPTVILLFFRLYNISQRRENLKNLNPRKFELRKNQNDWEKKFQSFKAMTHRQIIKIKKRDNVDVIAQ